MNLPNKLTVLRLCMVPIFLLFLCLPLPLSDTAIRIVTAVIFILTSLTDMLDGKIARTISSRISESSWIRWRTNSL